MVVSHPISAFKPESGQEHTVFRLIQSGDDDDDDDDVDGKNKGKEIIIIMPCTTLL